MARIRTIKPSFFTDARMGSLPRDTRLLFIGLWTLSDDYGVVDAHPGRIAASLFGEDEDITPAIIHEGLMRLSGESRITLYRVPSGERYLQIVNWSRHQYVQKPSKHRLPGPDQATEVEQAPVLRRPSGDPPETLMVGRRKKEEGRRNIKADIIRLWNETFGSSHRVDPVGKLLSKHLDALLRHHTAEQINAVTLWVNRSHSKQAVWLRTEGHAKPTTCWRQSNFGRYLEDAEEELRQARKPAKPKRQAVFSHVDESGEPVYRYVEEEAAA